MTYHRDGTVTLWDVYEQQWRRLSAADLVRPGGRLLATLDARARARIERMAAKE